MSILSSINNILLYILTSEKYIPILINEKKNKLIIKMHFLFGIRLPANSGFGGARVPNIKGDRTEKKIIKI